jgi:hypothetical protein
MSAYGAPPAGAMFLGAALAWMVFIGIILLGVRLIFGAATSVVNSGRKLGQAFMPPEPKEVVEKFIATVGVKESPEPAVGRILLPGMTFGKKTLAEKMVKSVTEQHPELAPTLKQTKAGWGVEVNDIDE